MSLHRTHLVLPLVTGLLAFPGLALADEGDLTLRLELGAGAPFAGYLAPRGRYDEASNVAIAGDLTLDYQVVGPLAVEVIGGVGGLVELIDDSSVHETSITAQLGVGAKLRLLESRRLWLSVHGGAYRFDGWQGGGDAAAGYDFGLGERVDLGVFLRGQLTFKGSGPASVEGPDHYDAALYAGVSLAFGVASRPDEEPTAAEPAPPVDLDADDDGVLDADDGCVSAPEDVDAFEDTDGCPDPDNDADGVVDIADAAPNQPEDADGHEDADGAPDPDNDADGVLDGADRCPVVAGVATNAGCPDPDRDGDGVVDRLDNCPDEVGSAENRGCAVRQQVSIEGDQLVIVDTVYFRTNRAVIERRSFALLDNVAMVVSAHPEITRVRIEGHTDARGDHDRNVRLSQARADAVMAYLVRKGVDAGRLSAVGYGPDRPVVPNAASDEEHARNRRVAFHIEGADIPTRD